MVETKPSANAEKAPARLSSAYPPVAHPDAWLLAELNALDQFAADHVRTGKGGPFGAALRLYDATLDQWISVAGPAGNAVLTKGIGSAHAEAETLDQTTVQAVLAYRDQHPSHHLHLLQLSTAESCPACRAKQVTFMHQLMARGWPEDWPMVVAFGATYEQTAAIAGFNDRPYDEDLKRPTPALMTIHQTTHDQLAFEVVKDWPFAAITVGDEVISLIDRPGPLAMEVAAIQAAAQHQRAQGQDQPWRLDHHHPARLITSADAVGPLMWTECQWAAVGEIILVTDMPSTPPESPMMDNQALLAAIRAPYNAEGAVITVKHLGQGTGFANQAQQIWRDEIIATDPSQLYNGTDTP
ncbi:MAG: hypothetical protein AAF213_02055 [Pseudomonadota bacterium]